MLARESNANYPSRRREMANFAAREIKRVCKEIGPRPSGEEAERRAQAYVAESMKSVADRVEVEDFELHPKAFLGWVLTDVVLMLVSGVLLCLSLAGVFGAGRTAALAAATALTVLSLLFLVCEFLLYKPLLDPLFPRRRSQNVICTRAPEKEVRRRIVFCGHMDSAYEWTYLRLGGGKLFAAVVGAAFGSVFVQLVLDVLAFFEFSSAVDTVLLVLAALTTLLVLPGAFFVNWKRPVDGANDNLTGVFASMAVLRFFAANDIRFAHTEVSAVSMGCEEAGLRGAKAFARAHPDDGVETVYIVTDTLRDYAFLGVYNKDMTGLVRLDAGAAALVQRGAKNAGLDLPYAKVFFGASDAAALAQSGLRAATLAAMDPAPARYYHTRGDTADNLDLKTLEAGIDVLLETAFLYDAEGLPHDAAKAQE
ncbi:MAG TPA: M28 family peptidase [Candidatus Fimenecus excrementigallinarum]|uniref:Carboxypeptidase Q n=1 Tax=Candidatus Fimenecus excrementigallinarum TaxID=2840816 RepID=A0A9D1LD71_9FIRM|nr:M28 family peptidase [Candidatus Fimenecus excrementigallinarum]